MVNGSVFAGAGIEREEREPDLFEGFFLGLPLCLESRKFAAFGAPHPGAIFVDGEFSHTRSVYHNPADSERLRAREWGEAGVARRLVSRYMRGLPATVVSSMRELTLRKILLITQSGILSYAQGFDPCLPHPNVGDGKIKKE